MPPKPRRAREHPGNADIENLLSYRLSVVSNLLSRSQLRAFEPISGILSSEWRALVLVNSYGPLSVKNLSRHAGLDFGQTSRLVNRMCLSGLIAKERTEDARSVNLTLTAEGKALHRRLWAVAMECNDDFLESLSATERKVLMSALDILATKAKATLHANGRQPGTQTAARTSA